MNDSGLQNKVVIITGASRGIGRATAELFAQEGAALVLNYHQNHEAMNEVKAICQKAGASFIVVAGDIGLPQTAQQIYEAAMQAFGRIDVLVNNAGVVVENLLPMITEEEVATMLATNIQGTLWMSRAVLRAMLKQRSGVIINLSSALATRPGRGNAVYAGTKGFIESFTRALAVEVGRKNIRVNAVSPGIIETEMTAPLRALATETMQQQVSLQRFGQPQEVASVILFVASAQASYLHGAIIATDGGFLSGR